MSAQSYSNLANSNINGNLILSTSGSYIEFSDGSKQTTAGGGSGGNVSTNQDNTFETDYTQTFNSSAIFNNEVNFNNGPINFNEIVNITSYTSSNIIGQPLIENNATITNSVLLGNGIGDGIINLNNTVSIGNSSSYSSNTNTNGISIGTDSDLGNGYENNVAIGYGAKAYGNNSIAIGSQVSSNENEIVLGNDSNYVTIPNYLNFGNNTIQSTAFTYSGINLVNIGGTSQTSWNFNLQGLIANPPIFLNQILATNVESLQSQIYTGNYNLIPQFLNFSISSQIFQDTSVNSIFTATNPNAETQPIIFNGLYAGGINTLVTNSSIESATEVFSIGSANFNNVVTNTTASINPYFSTITGLAVLNITTNWNGTEYIIFTSYDFQTINISNNTTLDVGFTTYISGGTFTQVSNQQLNVNYSGGNIPTPISLQLTLR